MSHVDSHAGAACEEESKRLLTRLWPRVGADAFPPGLLWPGSDRCVEFVGSARGEDAAERDEEPAGRNGAEIRGLLREGTRLVISDAWGELDRWVSQYAGRRRHDRRLDLALLTLEGRAASVRQEWSRAIPFLYAAVGLADRLNEDPPEWRLCVDLLLVEALLDGARHEDARSRFETLGPLYSGTVVSPRSLALVWRVHTLLTMASGETGRAREEADLAVSLAQMSEDPSVEAWCRWTRGSLFSRLGAMSLAMTDLVRARELAERMADRPLLRRVLQDSRGPETWELTLAESRVFDLLAHGETNPDIAHSLHLSVRTVESHVSSILRKSGEGSRLRLVARFGNRTPLG